MAVASVAAAIVCRKGRAQRKRPFGRCPTSMEVQFESGEMSEPTTDAARRACRRRPNRGHDRVRLVTARPRARRIRTGQPRLGQAAANVVMTDSAVQLGRHATAYVAIVNGSSAIAPAPVWGIHVTRRWRRRHAWRQGTTRLVSSPSAGLNAKRPPISTTAFDLTTRSTKTSARRKQKSRATSRYPAFGRRYETQPMCWLAAVVTPSFANKARSFSTSGLPVVSSFSP